MRARMISSVSWITSEGSAGKKISEIIPYFKRDIILEKYDPKTVSKKSDLLFFCLPHTEAMLKIPAVYKNNIKIIDLSADYRLKNAKEYLKWYGVKPDFISYGAV